MEVPRDDTAAHEGAGEDDGDAHDSSAMDVDQTGQV